MPRSWPRGRHLASQTPCRHPQRLQMRTRLPHLFCGHWHQRSIHRLPFLTEPLREWALSTWRTPAKVRACSYGQAMPRCGTCLCPSAATDAQQIPGRHRRTQLRGKCMLAEPAQGNSWRLRGLLVNCEGIRDGSWTIGASQDGIAGWERPGQDNSAWGRPAQTAALSTRGRMVYRHVLRHILA